MSEREQQVAARAEGRTAQKALDYPWLSDVISQLNAYVVADRLPHALLLSGRTGLGKKRLIRAYAKRLLCEADPGTGFACHRCQSCLLFEAGNHPDYYYLQPAETSQQILIDQIRQLNQDLKLQPQYEQFRVVVICLAEQLNVSAANSFLKTLEEPGQRTVFLLISNSPSLLMPTIQTRCQHIRLPAPSIETVSRWLSETQNTENAQTLACFSGAAPLYAVELISSQKYEHRLTVLRMFIETQFKDSRALGLTETWVKYSPEFVVYILITGTLDMIRLAMHPEIQENALYHPDQKRQLSQTAALLQVKSLFDFLDQIYRAKRLLSTQVNMQLVFENCFIQWRLMIANQTGCNS